MKNIEDLLSNDEKVIKSFKPSLLRLLIMSKGIFIAIALFILLIFAHFKFNLAIGFSVIALFVFICASCKPYISYKFTNYILTNKKIFIETGILGKDYDIIKLDRVIDINIDVDPIDAMLGTGSVKFATANDTDPLIIKHIKRPREIVRMLEN